MTLLRQSFDPRGHLKIHLFHEWATLSDGFDTRRFFYSIVVVVVVVHARLVGEKMEVNGKFFIDNQNHKNERIT